jgi:hypothetical protein
VVTSAEHRKEKQSWTTRRLGLVGHVLGKIVRVGRSVCLYSLAMRSSVNPVVDLRRQIGVDSGPPPWDN